MCSWRMMASSCPWNSRTPHESSDCAVFGWASLLWSLLQDPSVSRGRTSIALIVLLSLLCVVSR